MGTKGGSGGGSNQMGFQATTSTYTPNPEAMQAYRQALGMAENVASIPYEAYQGQMTAGFTPDQIAAFQGTREMQGMAQPYINAATSAVNQSMNLADPRNFTPAALQQYYNPYQQNVIESSKAMMAQQNAQQQADLTARAIQQGAYGGDRSGVARAALMGQQALANQQVLAGLQQQGYQQAVSQYNQQQQQAIGAAQQGAYSLGQLGLQGQQAALQGIQALLGTGGMQQQLGQQQLTAAYNQWLQSRAYPYQQANFYAGIASGIAPNMGGTTNTMGIGNSQTQQQQASGGGGGAGMLTSALSFLPMLFGGSDRDDKTDIQYLGKDPDTGEKLYSYRYKGDPKSYPKVVGPMAQDIEKDDPDRVREVGGHKIVEGLGHLSPSQREGRANGGSSIYGSPTVDPTAYQKSPYEANQAFDPGFKTGLEAVIDPAMANQIARSRWVSQQPDESQSQQTIDEQMQYRNPEYNLFPYFQDGQQSQSPFDGNAERPQMYADGGGVGGLGDLMKAKTPFGAAAPYVEALPITPGKAHIPEPPRMNWLPGLPGGGPSGGGGGGGGSGGGGGMPKLPKMGGSKAASAGAAAPEAAAAAQSPEAASSAPTPEAATAAPATEAAAAPAPDMGAAAAPAMDAGLGGLGGGIGDIFSGLGGMLPMFNHGGRVHMDGGGAAGAAGPSGAIGSSGFEGALGAGVGAIPGLIGQEGTGTLGSLMPSFKPAPTKGPMGDMSYKGWLDRAMMLDPGPQTTPEEQGQPSLPKPGSQPPRPFMPGEMQSKVVGEQNKGIDPMLMMGMGKMGGNLAMSTMLSNQQASNDAKSLQKEYQQKRADILATPQAPAGYSQSLASNMFNPHTGLFNVNYGTYYMPHYADGGRVGMADGGDPTRYQPTSRDLDYWARTVAREAANQGDKGMAAVAHAIKNRLESGRYGRSIADVVTAHNQFSPWNYKMRGTHNDPRLLSVNSPEYKKAMEIVQGVASGKIPNPIGSAVNFANPALSSSRSLRTWINPMIRSGNAIRIGEHVFGTPPGVSPGARRYAVSAPYGSPQTAPVSMAKVHPVTGEHPVVAADQRPVTQPEPMPSQAAPAGSVLNRINPKDPSGPLLGQPPIPPSANMPQTAPAPVKPGFGFASLINPMGTAHADEAGPSMPEGVIPRIRPGFEAIQGPSQLAGLQATKQLSPTSLNAAMGTPKTGISGLDMERFTPPGMAGDRDLMGAQPQGFGTFAPSDFGPEASKPQAPWESPVIAESGPERAAPSPAPKRAEPQAPVGEKGKFFGDYRDYEPWASDPIGKALDDIMGEKPMSSHKGASMWDVGGGETQGGGFDLGDIGDLFKQYGGRVGMADGGDPLANIDPEMFSEEPMSEDQSGFTPEALSADDQVDPNDRIVATDRPEQREQPQQQQPGFGGLTSPITGKPMVWGPASQALLAAGLGMMASDRVNPLQAIGEGGLRGLEYYQSASAQEKAQQAAEARLAREMEQRKTAEQHWQTEQQHKRNVLEAMERARAAGKIGVIGTDMNGYPIRGWVSGEKAGQPLDSSELLPSTIKTGVEGLHGEDYLNTLPGDMAPTVKAIAEGKMSIPPGRYGMPLRKAVTQYDPDYSEQRKKVRDSFDSTDFNKAGGQIIAGNTALGHLGELSDAAHALGNRGLKAWNWARQTGKSLTFGNPELEVFQTVKDRFNEEATKFYRGTGGTEADIKRALDRLDAAKTPQELDAVIAEESKLFESKIKSLEDQWRKTMKSDAIETGGDVNYEVVRGHAKEALDKIRARTSGEIGATELPPPEKRQVGMEWKNKHGKTMIWDGNGWRPK